MNLPSAEKLQEILSQGRPGQAAALLEHADAAQAAGNRRW